MCDEYRNNSTYVIMNDSFSCFGSTVHLFQRDARDSDVPLIHTFSLGHLLHRFVGKNVIQGI